MKERIVKEKSLWITLMMIHVQIALVVHQHQTVVHHHHAQQSVVALHLNVLDAKMLECATYFLMNVTNVLVAPIQIHIAIRYAPTRKCAVLMEPCVQDVLDAAIHQILVQVV